MRHGQYLALTPRWLEMRPLRGEEWRSVHAPFALIYEVSNKGRVRTLYQSDDCLFENTVGRVNKPTPDTKGYLRVNLLTESGERKCVKVHRLVAMAFVSNPEGKPTIDHINGDIADNSANNLRWVTVKENNHNPVTRERFLDAMEQVRKRKRRVVVRSSKGKKVRVFDSVQEASKFIGRASGSVYNGIAKKGKYELYSHGLLVYSVYLEK